VVKIVNRFVEPSHILVNGVISELRFIGLFGTYDQSRNGMLGGSSQVFHINLDATPEIFSGQLKSESDLSEVKFRTVYEALEEGLAYEQSEMLRRAFRA
jgi:hypothetical protein